MAKTPGEDEMASLLPVRTHSGGCDEVRDMDKLLRRPAPLDQLLAVEAARRDHAVYLVPVEPERPMRQRLDQHEPAQRDRILHAAVQQHVIDPAVLAFLADPVVRQHLVGWAGELQVMRRHHRRHAGALQGVEDRRRNVMVDVVSVGDVGRRGVHERAELPARLERIDDLGRLGGFRQRPALAAVFDLVDLLGGGLITNLIKHNRMDGAMQEVEQTQPLLRQLSKELNELSLPEDIGLDIGGFAVFADFFFDGLFADLYVQSKIRAFQHRLEETLSTLARVDDALCELDVHEVERLRSLGAL